MQTTPARFGHLSRPCVFLSTNKGLVTTASPRDAGEFTVLRRRPRYGESPKQEYLDKADPWPLNPDGELLLGVKEEDKYAQMNVAENLKVPGIGFAEWGPGDTALSLGIREQGAAALQDPRMKAARAKVFAACKANHIFFLNQFESNDVIDMIKEGVMVGPASPETAEIGRKFTKRPLPCAR